MPEINIIFDGPPAHESGRFIEVENNQGASINVGEWDERDNGYWALRIQVPTDRNPAAQIEDATRCIDESSLIHDWDEKERMIFAMRAQAQATLALAEEQRTTNLIALTQQPGTSGLTINDETLTAVVQNRLGMDHYSVAD